MSNRYSRRSILQALGLGSAWLPLLHATRVGAQSVSSKPPNVVFIAWPNGSRFFMPATAANQTFTISQAEDSILKPLTPWQSRIMVLRGLEIRNLKDVGMGGGHAAMPFIFTGVPGAPFSGKISDGVGLTAGGPSVDYWLSSQIAAKEGGTAEQRLLVQRTHRQTGNDIYLSFRGSPVGGRPNAVQPYDDPVELFDKLFATHKQTDAQIAKLRAERKSVLDVVGRQLERRCQRLGNEDRQKCDAHLTAVREYEKAAAAIAATGCTTPASPDRSANYLAELKNPLVPDIQRLQMGMLTTAFACGIARTGSLQWCSSHNNQFHFSWLASKDSTLAGGSLNPSETGGGPSSFLQHHEIAHNEHLAGGLNNTGPNIRRKNFVDQWFVQQVADLMTRLYAVKEGDATLLDRTLIVFSNLQRYGGDHVLEDMPVLLAGNCNGYFRMGRSMLWPSGTPGTYAGMHRLLAEVCRAMGFERNTFGPYSGNLPSLRT